MFNSAVFTELSVPPVIFFIHAELIHTCVKDVESFFSLAAADDLADSRNEKVACRNCLAVIVHAHIEGFDVLWIVCDEYRLFEYLFCEVSFVFCLKVAAPVRIKVKLLVCL